jgi:tellurite methyltransferase
MRKPLELPGIHPSALLIEAVKHSTGGTALHLGASSGRNSLYLAANGFKVTAVDSNKSSMEVLSFAAHHAGLPLAVLLADTSEFTPETTYDLVLGSAMVHLFDRQSIDETIRMMQSITKPGGINVLLISAENDESGERPRLFESGILPGYYAGWELIAEEEKLAAQFDLDPSHFHRAGLIAKRL